MLFRTLRNFLSLAMAFVVLVSSASAGVMISFQNLPTSYTANTPFTFDVFLENYSNLNSYNIELVMSAASGTPGTDFYFTGGTDGGLFGDGNFLASPVLSAITLSDFSNTNLELNGISSLIATVSAIALVDVGAITISIEPTTLELLDSAFDEIPDFDRNDIVGQAIANLPLNNNQVIPEPTSMSVFGLLSLAAVTFSRRKKLTCLHVA